MEKINDDVAEPFSEAEVLKQLQFMSDENMSIWWQPENDSVLFF
jgi:hypothetical protein